MSSYSGGHDFVPHATEHTFADHRRTTGRRSRARRVGSAGADDAKRARILADAIRARFAQTLVGQDNLRESLIVTLVAGGHILIESVPGLAKTTAAQTLATCVSGSFKRVQCTPRSHAI